MKANIKTQVLKAALVNLVRIIPKKSLMMQTEDVLICAENDTITLTTTDLETSMVVTISGKNCKVTVPGKISIPAQFLLDIVKNIEDETVTLNDKPKTSVIIEWGRGNATIPVFEPNDFPKIILAGEDAGEFAIGAKDLQEGVLSVIYSMTDDPLRPALNGIFFEASEGALALASSDAARLAIANIPDVPAKGSMSFIAPEKAVRMIKNIFSEDDSVSIRLDDKAVTFVAKDITLTTKPVTEKFPQYKAVIPQNNDKTLTANREALLDTLKRISICGDRSLRIVAFKITSGLMDATLEMSAADVNFKTSGKETMPVEFTGENITIGIKASSLIEILSSMDSETVKITMSTPSKAMVIIPESDNKITSQAIMMPVRFE